MRRQIRLTLGLLLLLVISASPIQIFAHTALVEMSPKSASQLEQSPEYVWLRFSQKLEAISDQSVSIVDEGGKSIETGNIELGDKGKSVRLELPLLAKGSYIVRYHVMSLDGHMVEGNYSFTVLTDQEEATEPSPIISDTTPIIKEPAVEPQAPAPDPIQVDYGTAPTDEIPSEGNRWLAVFTEISMDDVLSMVYFVIFLLLAGMSGWYLILRRGRSEEDALRQRNWILLIQRIHILVLIVVVVEFVRNAVGFEDGQLVRDILLHTTSGTSWLIILVLSIIGLVVLQRNTIVDLLWLLLVVAFMSQIGHAASSPYRVIASIVTATHLLAAATWAGGLLYILLLLRNYRDTVGQLIVKFSNASLIAISLIVLSGMISSLLYLDDLSYVFETRWGHILMIKVAVVVIVVCIGAIIRRRYIRRDLFQIGAWIKLDIVLLIVITSLATLLTAVEPNPPNEPLRWHVMGEDIHMTAEITPKVPGNNQFALTVWLPEQSGEPKSVTMNVALNPDGEKQSIDLRLVEELNDYGFGGFVEYAYQVDSNQLDQAGIWSIDIEVTDQQGQSWTYKKQMRVY